MTKIDVVSGFLGAGKTTLIKKLLKEALDGSKTVLIENEFGEIGAAIKHVHARVEQFLECALLEGERAFLEIISELAGDGLQSFCGFTK